ncbi:hypothetical protein [Bacillus cereus group sp. BfR-BA-01319]|uniref:hypothetical protein n=1 Tax=Bacillus cereus group sp. BfR-BA-01319 TaxID=2920296 RepID=UPI001F5A66EF|nr:hypothetical protein [Bacillus cereus group sp. BfR-BA-01319]
MATPQLGNSLPSPELGWTRKFCNKSNVGTFFKNIRVGNDNFNASWQYMGSDTKPTEESSWFSIGYPKSSDDDIFSFEFTGTSLRILQKYTSGHRRNIKVRIDDGYWMDGSVIRNPSAIFTVCFEILDLPRGTHKVEVIAFGFTAGSIDREYTTMISAIDYADLGAKVGDVLAQPEPGWKRFDDTDSNIKYEGVWATESSSKYYNSTFHYKHNQSNNPPDTNPVSVKFKFTGTKLRIIGLVYSIYDADAKILVDGKEELISFFRPAGQSPTYQALIYEKLGLTNQEHIVEIKGYFINLDAIDIDANGELGPFKQKKTKVSLYEKESGKIFVDDFDSVNPKWLMSPSNSFNNAVKKGFLRMNHSADKDVMLLIDKPQDKFAIQVIADYAPTKEGDEGGLLIYQNEKNKVEFLESYAANSYQSNKEWMAICKEDQWDFYTKTDTFFDYADNDSLAAKRIGVVLKRGTAEGFVPLDVNKIIMTRSNMLRLRQLYENYKVVLKDTADNTLSTNIVAAAHTGIDILLPSLEFEGIIEIYDEENELLAKKQATFYGGDMYCMGSSLQIKMNSEELNTTDPTNLGYMVNNERIVKMTIVNDNIGAATNIKLSIEQYMEKVGYTWALISLDGTNYSNEIQIDSVAAQDTRGFWVKVVKDTNFLAFEPVYFNIHLKHN